MNELQIFQNEEFGQVRIVDRNGNPWFVAVDVCRILGLSNLTETLKRLEKDELSITEVTDSIGRKQSSYIVNEPGLYALILRSRKPEAKKFKRWITHEVIPAIRKHGGYLTPQKIEEVLTDPDTIIELATRLKEERQRRLELEGFTKQIAASKNSLLVRQVAKVASKKGITIGEKRLWNKLRDWGLIFKNSTEPKQEYVDRGYFEVVEGVRETEKGTFTYRTTRVTGKGQIYIINRLLKEQASNSC